MVNIYGIQKVKNYYANGDFNKSFSSNLDSVIINYELFLDTLADSSISDKAIYYFGQKPLISKVCPRYIASSITQAWNYYSSKQNIEAEIIFENILSKAESYGAIIGLAKIYEDQDSLWKAIKLLQTNIISFDRTSYEYNLKFLLADLYAKDNEYEKSRELYSYLADVKPNRRLELVSKVRLSLLKNDLLNKYVTGSDYDKYQILKEINLKDYNYASIPLMIDLSESLEEDYEFFLSNFKNNFEVKDEISSYAVYKISQYMLQNQDYPRAKKMAGISLRYKNNTDLLFITQNNFNKIDWFTRYAENVLHQTKFQSD